jgi:hypothetical protein
MITALVNYFPTRVILSKVVSPALCFCNTLRKSSGSSTISKINVNYIGVLRIDGMWLAFSCMVKRHARSSNAPYCTCKLKHPLTTTHESSWLAPLSI